MQTSIDIILASTDKTLYKGMQNNVHCLHCELPCTKYAATSLRNRYQNYILPVCKYEFFKKSFVIRNLYYTCNQIYSVKL